MAAVVIVLLIKRLPFSPPPEQLQPSVVLESLADQAGVLAAETTAGTIAAQRGPTRPLHSTVGAR